MSRSESYGGGLRVVFTRPLTQEDFAPPDDSSSLRPDHTSTSSIASQERQQPGRAQSTESEEQGTTGGFEAEESTQQPVVYYPHLFPEDRSAIEEIRRAEILLLPYRPYAPPLYTEEEFFISKINIQERRRVAALKTASSPTPITGNAASATSVNADSPAGLNHYSDYDVPAEGFEAERCSHATTLSSIPISTRSTSSTAWPRSAGSPDEFGYDSDYDIPTEGSEAERGPRVAAVPVFPPRACEKPSSRRSTATMEPRARIGKNRGQQTFQDQELNHLLFAHGDVREPLESTRRVLDESLTEFITELCFEAHRSAQLAGRQKIKLDDIKFACRNNPAYLGRVEEILSKKSEIDKARKAVDTNDDKINKSNLKAMEEPLGEADDDKDFDARTVGGKSTKSAGKKK